MASILTASLDVSVEVDKMVGTHRFTDYKGNVNNTP
jgi:hypothetical protein